EVIKKIKPLGIRTLELGTGNYPGDPHLKLEWLSSPPQLKEFKQKLDDQGIAISALSCHGNPLHPNKQFAQNCVEVSRKTILLAQKLGVKTVIDFSGCPGDSDNAKYPRMYDVNFKVNGVLDTKPYSDERHRSFLFRTVGYGHGSDFWADLVSTLQMVGYDDVLSIEHEDSLMSIDEGLTKAATFLNNIVIKEKLKEMWWA